MLLWAVIVAFLHPKLLIWLGLVFAGPLLAIPLSHFTGSKVMGRRARDKGWFTVPEEVRTPQELCDVQESFVVPAMIPSHPQRKSADFGLLLAVVDPLVNAVHVSLLRHRTRVNHPTRQHINLLSERLLREGPAMLSPREKRAVLWNAEALLWAHRHLWSSPASQLNEWWRNALQCYSDSSDPPVQTPARGTPGRSTSPATKPQNTPVATPGWEALNPGVPSSARKIG
jgi:membrane glycosyltransferase